MSNNETNEIEVKEEESTSVMIDGQEVKISGGILLLRTEDGSIVYEKVEKVTWEDITMFSEYLNRLKDVVWDEQVGGSANED